MTTPTTDTGSTPAGQRRLLTIAEVAEWLGVTVRHVRRLVHERRIPFIKWGHLLRFDPDEVEAWIRRHHIGALAPFNNSPEPGRRRSARNDRPRSVAGTIDVGSPGAAGPCLIHFQSRSERWHAAVASSERSAS